MLKKFNHINCATYKNFNWKLDEFGQINIIYGHNGAGKTTLSRIIRSFETKELPQGYDDIKFKKFWDIFKNRMKKYEYINEEDWD